MSNQILSRIHRVFPPMFKRGEGLDYTLAVFRRRIMSFFWAFLILAIAFMVCWFVVPPSLSTQGDWYRLIRNAVIVIIGIFAAGWAFMYVRKMNREIAETRALRASGPPINDAEEAQQFGQALAAIMAIASMPDVVKPKWTVRPEKSPEFVIANDLIGKTFLVQSKYSRAKLRTEEHHQIIFTSFAYGYGLTHLLASANLRLFMLNDLDLISGSFRVSDETMERLKGVASGAKITIEQAQGKELSVSLVDVVRVVRGAQSWDIDVAPEHQDAPMSIARTTVDWLSSIHIGIAEALSMRVPKTGMP
jgi:hypothetical protein